MPIKAKTTVGGAILLICLALLQGSFLRTPTTGSAHPGILTVPAQYPTIQSAVNAAFPGDTILVAAGTYKENVVVTKSVNITGASPGTTVIDAQGNGPGINMTGVNGVSIQDFTINDTGFFYNAVFVNDSNTILISRSILSASPQSNGVFSQDSNQVSVSNNLIPGNLYGVQFQGGFGNSVQFNNITGNSVGVAILSSFGNKVTDNSVRKGHIGIELWKGSTGNVLARNQVSNNTFWGISVQNAANNLVFENNVEFNNADPMNTEGFNIQNAMGNRFYHNNIVSNSIQASAVYPPGDLNMWDNASGAVLKSDPRIEFVNATMSNSWNFNETVVYDTNGDGLYETGEPVIGSVNGAVPPMGTKLLSSPGLKFVDRIGDGVWHRGDPVVNDTNADGVFEPGEPAIAGVGGNFWSDYAGKDNGANGFGLNGIGDTLIPTPCPNGGQSTATCPAGSPREEDWYPLMVRWVPPNINVTATASPSSGYPPLQVAFQGRVAGGTAPYNYTWNFGDGSIGQGSSIVHTYAAKGSFVAVLTVTDSAFRSRSDSVGISAVVGTLLVKVVDSSAKPIDRANVSSTSQPTRQQRLTGLVNSSGLVKFTDLRNGTYGLSVSANGFGPQSLSLVVFPNRYTNITFVLIAPPSVPGPGIPAVVLVGGAVAGVAVAVVLVWWYRKRKRQRMSAGTASPAG